MHPVDNTTIEKFANAFNKAYQSKTKVRLICKEAASSLGHGGILVITMEIDDDSFLDEAYTRGDALIRLKPDFYNMVYQCADRAGLILKWNNTYNVASVYKRDS